MRDEELQALIKRVDEADYRAYGTRKIWRALNRQGHDVARCTVERLMREIGIADAVRGKKVSITIPDPAAAGPRTAWTVTSSPRSPTAPGQPTSLKPLSVVIMAG